MCAVDTGENEEELVEEFAKQYREPELEEPYRGQELPEALKMASSISSFDCIFNPVL